MLIVNEKQGRFANRLISFSFFIANSIDHNYTLIYPYFAEYKSFFEATDSNIFGLKNKVSLRITRFLPLNYVLYFLNLVVIKIIFKYVRKTVEIKNTWFWYFYNPNQFTISVILDMKSPELRDMQDPEFIHYAKNKLILQGSWINRDRAGVTKYHEEITRIFTPKKMYQDTIDAIIYNAKQEADCVVGVHIRRGDFKQFAGGRWFFEDAIYCEKLKSIETQLQQNNKTVKFILCSAENIDLSNFKGLNIDFEFRLHIVDMYLLAKCDYILSPGGTTFAMWASYYGKIPLKQLEYADDTVNLNSDFEIRESLM